MLGTILVIDDEVVFARSLAKLLERQGYHVALAHTAAEAKTRMAESDADVVLVDLKLPDADGGELMRGLKKEHPNARFIIITGHGSIKSAVQLTQTGAVDYLTKPFDPEEVYVAVRNAIKYRATDDEVRFLRKTAMMNSRRPPIDTVLHSESVAMRKTVEQAKRAAAQDGIVLLLGESGTGKDHLARWIHQQSRRSDGPFFAINCAAVSRDLAESELFGHEPGAFTGTRGRKRGLLELAEKGTLLLDEIGELEPALQSKLLTFLDTREFLRVGGEKRVRVDARILAATNRDLALEVENGRFRKDLYYRINVLPIQVPPLRERREDIPLLVEEMLGRLTAEMGLAERPQVESRARDAMVSYFWPGNVRELRNVVERAIIVAGRAPITPADLALEGETNSEFSIVVRFPNERQTLHDITRDVAKGLISEALRRGGTKQDAARLLNISRHALAHQLRALELEK